MLQPQPSQAGLAAIVAPRPIRSPRPESGLACFVDLAGLTMISEALGANAGEWERAAAAADGRNPVELLTGADQLNARLGSGAGQS